MDYYEQRDGAHDEPEKSIDTTRTNSEIQQFYAGKSVFITGSTGLIGCLLLEHLMRTCPKIGKIYLLLRPKKNKSVEERLHDLFESQVFYKVKRMYRDPKKKVEVIFGDCSLPYCGISENDQNTLIDNVEIVFHSAAALRMDEPLRTAYYMNVRATEDLLNLATRMKKLKAFIYVSTAYTHSFLNDISEKFYETEFKREDLEKLIELLGDKDLASLSPKLYGQFTNSYAFTKAIAEKVTEKYSHMIPAAVARPSIVIGTEKEPLRAWINNIYGATGVSLAACLGIMRVWYGDVDKIADIIPADKVVSAMIAIAWRVGVRQKIGKNIEPPVYNIVSSTKSPQTWGDYMMYTEYYGKRDKIATRKFIREYDFHQEKRFWLFIIKVWFYHFLFGIIVDQILKFKGKQPMLLRGFTKIHRFNLNLNFYVHREWVYNQDNVDRVWSEMSPLDKKIFNFSMKNFQWQSYHSYTIRGISVYLLNDDLSKVNDGRKRHQRLIYIRWTITFVIAAILAYLFRGYIFHCYYTIRKWVLFDDIYL